MLAKSYPRPRFDNIYFYWVSLDEIEKVYDSIRGKGSYLKTKNIQEYIKWPDVNGKPAWKEIWITMTINSVIIQLRSWLMNGMDSK